MSDQLLANNIIAFLVAGYDTTAFALTWTLYLISQSPEWEARILEEVDRSPVKVRSPPRMSKNSSPFNRS